MVPIFGTKANEIIVKHIQTIDTFVLRKISIFIFLDFWSANVYTKAQVLIDSHFFFIFIAHFWLL